MKKLVILILVFAISQSMFGKVAGVLEGLMKPTSIAVGDDWIYVAQEATIFIYDLNTLELVKKFGKQGEGPEEFPVIPGLPLNVLVQEDHIQVNSANRITLFKKDGTFIKMIKAKGGTLTLAHQPVGDHYVAIGFSEEDGIIYYSINLYDAELNKLKTLAKVKRSIQQTGSIKLFSDAMQLATFQDKIYLTSEQDFTVYTLNIKGDILNTYQMKDYKRVKFEDVHKDLIFETIEKDPIQRGYLDIFKQRAEFPQYFPAIFSLFVVDDSIYVITWDRQGEKFKFFLFDTDWKLKDELYLGFKMQGGLSPYPTAFSKGNLYQVIENDNEEWELHVTPVKK